MIFPLQTIGAVALEYAKQRKRGANNAVCPVCERKKGIPETDKEYENRKLDIQMRGAIGNVCVNKLSLEKITKKAKKLEVKLPDMEEVKEKIQQIRNLDKKWRGRYDNCGVADESRRHVFVGGGRKHMKSGSN
jgi:uncharacterized Zn finger protein (UPF0148 family)